MLFLIYGGKGWIGSMVSKLLTESGHKVMHGVSRVDDSSELTKELLAIYADRVLCFVGRTHGEGVSTIDYLEKPGKLTENIRDNLFSPISLALLCNRMGIHMTYLGTGCIFNDEVPEETDGYDEYSLPNFYGSSYSTVKGFTDMLMHQLYGVLNVRIRMPIVGYDNPRNFITKIVGYKKVVNVQNSMSVLHELLPLLIDMSINKRCGTINLTNPGTISHNEVLELYKEHVDPNFTWENFTLEEQDELLDSKRSNNKLNTDMLQSLYPEVKDINTSLKELLQNYNKTT